MEDIKLLRKDLNEIKVEISFIKNWLLDDEANLEVSDEVVRDVEESRQRPQSEFISHEDVVAEFLNEN